MWTCWFFKCATISPALPKHCHEPRVLHSRCLLLIIEKLIGFMSGTGQYQPSSAIIIGMLAGSRSCFTSNNSFTLLHSPLTMKARGIRLPLRRWTSNQSSSNIYPYTHESGSITGGVCSDEGQRESVNKEQHDTQTDETRVRGHSVSHSRCWCCRKYQFPLQPLKHATRNDAGIHLMGLYLIRSHQGGMDGAFLLSSSFLPDAPRPVQTCCCVARLPPMENMQEAAFLSRFQTRTHARRTGLY